MARPQPDIYNLPNLEIDFSFKKLFFSIVFILFFLVAPIVIIDGTIKNTSSQNQAQVAGISTSTTEVSESYLYLFGQKFDLNSQAGVFAIAGLTLLGIAIILILFLLADSFLRQSKNNG